MNDQSPDLNLSTPTDITRSPVSRRSVLAGSALAVPAIMMTASTPALAASGLTLTFDQPSYSGEGCSTISGVTATASDGGIGRAGLSVTVSLSNGYTFTGGGTTSTGVTGTGGSLTLPDITVPAAGGSGTATASSAGATSASASLSGTVAVRFAYLQNEIEYAAINVPTGSAPAFSASFLAPDGRLINGGTGTTQATNVDSFGQIYVATDRSFWSAPLKRKDGTFAYLQNETEYAAINVPTGSTPAFSASFLAPDGRLINGGTGTTQATNVDSFGQIFVAPDRRFWSVPLKKKDGTFTYLQNETEYAAINVPTGSTPAFSASFLAPDGRLINGGTGTTQATNVDSFGQIYVATDRSFWSAPLKKKDGTFTYLQNETEYAAINVPTGSTPAFSASFLAPDGRLINGGTGTTQATSVDSFGQIFVAPDGSSWAVPLKQNKTTC